MDQDALREQIRQCEKHIIDVGMGRVRLGLQPHEVDDYLAAEKQRLDQLQEALGRV